MFSRNETWLDKEIARTDRKLANATFGNPEYTKLFQFRLQLEELKNKNSSPFSKDTLVVAGTNLLGIILIIKHEQFNVVASKAMGLIMKTRVP